MPERIDFRGPGRRRMRSLKSGRTMRLDRAMAPRRGCELEWWFIHGEYAGAGRSGRRRHFMAALFRHRLNTGGSAGPAFSLLLSVLDPAGKTHKLSSRIDPAMRDSFIKNPDLIGKLPVDRKFLDVFLAELEKSGPPRPVKVENGPVVLKDNPPDVSWSDFSLRAGPGHLELCFKEPESRCKAALDLRPTRPVMETAMDRRAEVFSRTTHCLTYPRLSLTGSVGGRPVAGEAWLDHQWGDHVWYLRKEKRCKPLSWDRLALNLDDGSDWIVSETRDVRSRRRLGRRLAFSANGVQWEIERFVLEPIRHWESPRSGIQYPVEWRLQVPELDADLVFQPLLDDQEIPVFGVMRAVWDGAGLVSGTVGRHVVTGRARGMFQGYGYLFDVRNTWSAAADRVDRRLRTFFPAVLTGENIRTYLGGSDLDGEPEVYTRMLSAPVWNLLERGGKRWRPILGMLLLRALGRDMGDFDLLISVVAELGHTGSLIVDDIEDRSRLRRGGECLHLRYGQDLAINASNTLYFLPQILIESQTGLSVREKLTLHQTLARQFVRAHFGQARDLDWSRSMTRDLMKTRLNGGNGQDILRMYELKTAAPIMGLAEIVAIIAGSGASVRKACISYARALGIAFQLMDDVRDVAGPWNGNSEPGEDLAQGKWTYVIFRALRRLPPAQRSELIDILSAPEKRADPKMRKAGAALIRRSGVLAECRRKAKALVVPEWENLSRRLPPSEPKFLLRLLTERLIEGGSVSKAVKRRK